MNDSAAFFGLHNTTQVPYTFRAGFFVALLVVALVSVTGNVLLIITFLKTLNLRISTNYYITSMAISDLLSVATNMALFTKSSHSIFQHSLSSFDCKFKIYSSYVSYSVSIISLVLITVDRFVATVFPMKVAIITRKIRAVFILLTWVLSMGIIYPLFHFSRTATKALRPYLCQTDMNINRVPRTIYFMVGFVLLYCVPLVIISILSYRIIKSSRRANPVIEGNRHVRSRRRERNERLLKTVLSINVSFFICWTAYFSVSCLLLFLKSVKGDSFEMFFMVVYYFIPFVSTTVNPVVLFTFSTNYRQALKNCLPHVTCVSCANILRLNKIDAGKADVKTVDLLELQTF